MSKFALLFLMTFVGGVVAALFYSSAAAFLLYEIIYFLNPDERWWSAQIPGISYSFFSALLMLSVLVWRFRDLSQASPWFQHPTFKWMLLLLGSYYLAYFWALVPEDHHQFTFIFLKLLIVIFAAYKLLKHEKSLDMALWAYVIGCTYIGYLATLSGRNMGTRLEGITLADSPGGNPVAAALVPACAILLYFAWMGNKKVKLLCVVCGALIANALVLFNSRGAFLGIVASVGVYLLFMLFSRHRQKGQRGMAIVIMLLGIMGGLSLTDDVFWQRMSTLENVEIGQGGAGRITFWLATFDMMEDHPLGMGVRGYNSISRFYMTEAERQSSDGRGKYRAVHSLWFQGLSEVGWHGLLIFLIMLWSLYRFSRRAKAAAIGGGDIAIYFKILALECALFGYLVSGSFIDQFRAEILYWMILFVAVATKVYYLQPRTEEQKVKSKASPKGPFKKYSPPAGSV